jgi:hypothetical protein
MAPGSPSLLERGLAQPRGANRGTVYRVMADSGGSAGVRDWLRAGGGACERVPEFSHSYLHLSIMVFIDLIQSPLQPLPFRLPSQLRPANRLRHSAAEHGRANRSSHTLRPACQPQLAVALVGIDVPLLVAARHHMVSGPGILDAYLACLRRSSWTQPRH